MVVVLVVMVVVVVVLMNVMLSRGCCIVCCGVNIQIHLKSKKRAGSLGGILCRILQDRHYPFLVHGLFVVVIMVVAMQMVVLGITILVIVTTMQLPFVL